MRANTKSCCRRSGGRRTDAAAGFLMQPAAHYLEGAQAHMLDPSDSGGHAQTRYLPPSSFPKRAAIRNEAIRCEATSVDDWRRVAQRAMSFVFAAFEGPSKAQLSDK